jgi:hypothetical protein
MYVLAHTLATFCLDNGLRFSLLTLLFSSLALVAFMGLSAATGLLRLGQTQTYRLPQDYIEYGTGGWSIMVVGILVLLSPLLVTLAMKQCSLPGH